MNLRAVGPVEAERILKEAALRSLEIEPDLKADLEKIVADAKKKPVALGRRAAPEEELTRLGAWTEPTMDVAAVQKEIDDAANEAATSPKNDLPEPTQPQKEAGNYPKGHISAYGMPITIENPKGSMRKGIDQTGKPWSTEMKSGHYGYFKRSEGKDGDQIDVIVGNKIVGNSKAFIVDQVDPETGKFDEHKTLVGFKDLEAAKAGYLANYEKGWKGLGAITELTTEKFKEWISDGKRKKVAYAYKGPETKPSRKPESPAETFVRLDKEKNKWAGKINKHPIGTIFSIPDNRGFGTLVGTWTRVDVAGDPFWRNEKTGDTKFISEFYATNVDETIKLPRPSPPIETAGVAPETEGEVKKEPWMMTRAAFLKPVRAAAYREKETGKIIEGAPEEVHFEIAERNNISFADIENKYETGFTDIKGEFLNRSEAAELVRRPDRKTQLTAHKEYVGQAISEGKPVPPNVLAEYPDLQPSPEAAGEVKKYPTADISKWYGDADYKQRGGRLVEMTPDEFLARAKPLEVDEEARDNIDDLKGHVESGRDLDPLAIYDNDKTKARNADGRQRAMAAKELGIEKVPVIDFIQAVVPKAKGKAPVTKVKKKVKIKEGDTVKFTPNKGEFIDPIEGIARDIIKNTSGGTGYHILAPVEGDPERVVRVWESQGDVEKVKKAPVLPKMTKETPKPRSPLKDISKVEHSSGSKTKAYLSDNTEIELQYVVVDASDLVASHDLNLNKNPDFPPELQPRDRERQGMELQIVSVANKLNPERLGESSSASQGAPIVGSDLVVESGNGRVIAIRKAYEKKSAEKYKAWVIKNADKFGIKNTDAMDDMATPVLVRVRLSDIDRVEFTKKANLADVARMSPAENAKSDADRLTDGDLSIFSPSEDGNVAASSNRPFIGRFLGKLGTNEAAGYTAADGKYTKQLIDRIEAAIFYKAYEDESLLALMSEVADPEIKNILNALIVAAPGYIEAKKVDKTLGNTKIIEHIVGATRVAQSARAGGETVKRFFQQLSMFDQVPGLTKKVALIFEDYKRSSKKLGKYLKAVAAKLKVELERRTNKMLPGFDIGDIDIERIIDSALTETEERYADKQRGLFGDDIQPDSGGPRNALADRRGGRGVETKEPKPGETPGGISDARKQYLISERKKFKFGAPKQLGFDFTVGPKEIAMVPETIPPPAQRVRMSTSGDIHAASYVSHNASEIATLLSHISDEAQEEAYAVAVDKNDTILEIHLYTRGKRGSSQIAPLEVAGRALNVPGIAKLYFVHNHPSRDPKASSEDVDVFGKIDGIMGLRNVDAEAVVLGGKSFTSWTHGHAKSLPAKIVQADKKYVLPVKRRVLERTEELYERELSPVFNSASFISTVKSRYGNLDGIMFLDSQNTDLGFLPLPQQGQSEKEGMALFISEAESMNAQAAVGNFKKDSPNRQRFIGSLLKAAGDIDITVHDVVLEGRSLADAGRLQSMAPVGVEIAGLMDDILFSTAASGNIGADARKVIEIVHNIMSNWANFPVVNV
ncbi:MAG: JAB domain-containing protein, partial [Candidatus Margulisiibacteriota bacterium]